MMSFAAAAGRLRIPQDEPRENVVVPRALHDIGEDTWLDARPALAMTMALISWTGIAFNGHDYDEYRQVSALFLDHTWIRDAVWNARALALRMEETLNPPCLLVPRRRVVRALDARLFPIRKQALTRLLNIPKKRG
jgi:hypothetical protein